MQEPIDLAWATLAKPYLSHPADADAARRTRRAESPAPATTWRPEPRHTTSRHIRAVRLWRARQIMRTIPTDLPLAQYIQCQRYVAKAVSLFGRRQLARVVWPWLPRQKDAGRGMPLPGRARRQALAAARTAGARTPRGRTANPTALP